MPRSIPPPFVAPQPLGDMDGGGIERGIGVLGTALALHQDALADMDADVGFEFPAFARHGDVRFDRILEIFGDNGRQTIFDMAAQGVANIDLLTVYGKLHLWVGPTVFSMVTATVLIPATRQGAAT